LEVDVQQGNFKILRFLLLVLMLFLVEKWISPTGSETPEIGKKIEGILGVKETIDINHVQFYFLPICYSDKKINII
jgi:hypothetical protein